VVLWNVIFLYLETNLFLCKIYSWIIINSVLATVMMTSNWNTKPSLHKPPCSQSQTYHCFMNKNGALVHK
jgi:hypothetical protein